MPQVCAASLINPPFTMPISFLSQFFFISLLSTIACISNFTHAYSQCLDDQKSLLLQLKNELIFPSSFPTKLVHWNKTGDCCSWEGVVCDGAGHVIGLQLDGEAISGGIENSSSLFRLRYLKKLNLAGNYFNNTQIPRGIGNLTCLTHLNLSHAGFSEQVPMELSLLRKLVSLDISSSYLISEDPEAPILNLGIQPLKLEHPNLRMFLQNLTGLRELVLDGVDLSAEKNDWYHAISSSLPELRNLSLRLCSLSSPSDPSLSQFHSLTILGLDGNNLSTVVPYFFANFSSLIALSLKNCSLNGSMDSSNNFFAGSNSSGLFQGLANLVYLNFGCNSLSGSIPQFLFSLPSLKKLILANNQFSGQLHQFPALNLSDIRFLDVRSNRLNGPIPESFFQLERLEVLLLSYNLFNGTFQMEKIQRLRNLKSFDISYNNLSVDVSRTNSSLSTFPQLQALGVASCNLYSFPDFIKQSSTLRTLDLSNNRIAGEIPSWIWEIGNGMLGYLNLSSNLLIGLQKPYKISSSLGVLDLHSNQLRGELSLPIIPIISPIIPIVPPIMPNIPNITGFSSSLVFISLANNSLTGSIPTSLCNNTAYLQVLDLSGNELTGNISPCLIVNTEHLEVFNLGRNNFSGDIPDKFPPNCGLKTLDLSNNNLGGKIPLSLRNCKSLELMNAGYNDFSDSFPCMLPSSLRVLVLRSNGFHGEVRCHKSWTNLQIIDIASNNFSGNLYQISFSSWKGMMLESGGAKLIHWGSNFLNPDPYNYYPDEVTLIIKGFELRLAKIWADFVSIDFSCNNFQGEIPDSISDLSSLYHLNLSHNALTGPIPKSFGKLRQLESLDLSVNQLTGTIPMEVAGLTFLSALNLSYNKLVGEIPDGPQFHTFPPACFEGNTGLCGKPVNISCSHTDENDSSPPKLEDVQPYGKTEIEWLYVSVALGYVVGLGSFVWVLLCCRCLREKYFEKVDEVLEKIFDRKHRSRRPEGRRVLRRE